MSKPTYSVNEVFALIKISDWRELDALDITIQEESDRYTPLELESLYWAIDIMYEKLQAEIEEECM